jgi:hypothetical protein
MARAEPKSSRVADTALKDFMLAGRPGNLGCHSTGNRGRAELIPANLKEHREPAGGPPGGFLLAQCRDRRSTATTVFSKGVRTWRLVP